MKRVITLLAAVAVLAGCKKDVEPTPSFAGQVQVVDEFGARQADSSGVLVTVSDVSPQVTTLTEADGSYYLTGVPDGVHTLVYSKAGYGTYKTGGWPSDPAKQVTLPDVAVGQVSTTLITTLNSPTRLADAIVISGTIRPLPTASQPRPHRLYLQGYNTSVPVAGPIATHYNFTQLRRTRADGTFTDTLSRYDLYVAGLTNEYTLVRVSGDNPAADVYIDPEVYGSKTVFPAANLAQNPRAAAF